MATTRPSRDSGTDGRCGAFELLDGDVVLYDRENAEAWIQASHAIDFENLWTESA